MLLTSVLEEKSNKILDALMTSVSPLQILAGKLIGVACVSATLFSIWGVIGALGLSRVAMLENASFAAALAHAALNPALALTFIACFVAGYLLYGAAFLGLGALCDSLQEAQTLISPIFVLLVLPIMLIAPAFESPKSPLIVAASWFPPFTPFIMMMRAPAGLSFADAVGPVAVTLVALALVLVGAARMFRAGVSHQLKLADLVARFRGKPARTRA
jgi:ABC-2 type transport system permease protein